MAEENKRKGDEFRSEGSRPGGGQGGDSSKKRSNRRRRNRSRTKRIIPSESHVCPICEQNIRDILTAISITEAKVPAHFDCVLKQIAQTEELQAREKVVYLGKGEFGIVKFRGGTSTKFVIRKRIPFEQVEGGIPWRKDISKRLRR